MPKQSQLHTIRVSLRNGSVREFQTDSWSIQDGLASVASEGRVIVWPLDQIAEWDVPLLPRPEAEEEDPATPPAGDDWHQV